jgi:hypothetical protein
MHHLNHSGQDAQFNKHSLSHSIQPVFDAQARHRFEIREVVGEQGGIVSQV